MGRALLPFIGPFIISMLMYPLVGHGQFTYIGGEVGHSKGGEINNWSVGFTVVHRPVRQLGFGLQVSTRMTKLGDPRATLYHPTGSGRHLLYHPQTYVHTLERSATITGVVRYFVETEFNIFVDVRVGTATFTENMTLVRSGAPAEYFDFTVPELRYAALDPVNIKEQVVHKMVIPGLHVGLSPHIHGPFYASLSGGVDLLSFPERAYVHSIANKPVYMQNRHDHRTITNAFHGLQVIGQYNLAFGLVF